LSEVGGIKHNEIGGRLLNRNTHYYGVLNWTFNVGVWYDTPGGIKHNEIVILNRNTIQIWDGKESNIVLYWMKKCYTG